MPTIREFRQKSNGVTKRLTLREKPDSAELEVHSTMLGYPIRFTITDELREFLKEL